MRGNRAADQRLGFCYTDSTIPLFLKIKIYASSHLLWVYSPVCIGPGKKKTKIGFVVTWLSHMRTKIKLNDKTIEWMFEPCREKTGFLHMRKTKTQISFVVTAKLISAFVFATR